jgi:uncharacterized protein
LVTTFYLDSSALIKRYVDEPGSRWVQTLVDASQSPVLVISQLVIVEMTSALNRRVRDGILTPGEYLSVLDAVRRDCLVEYQVLLISAGIVDLACDLLERHPLRSFDALHLASALTARRSFAEAGLPEPVFVCEDSRLLAAADAEGMAVDDPNQHA